MAYNTYGGRGGKYNLGQPMTWSGTSASTMSYYDTYYDQYGVSDRERYYREMAQGLQQELARVQRMMAPQFQVIGDPPKADDSNLHWLRQRVAEITTCGKLAA